jgi:transposase InsO family protein
MGHTHKFSVEKMCNAFKVSRSGYYKWLKASPKKEEELSRLDCLIKYEYEKSRCTYGSPRIALALNKEKYVCSKSTVARRMKSMSIHARKKVKYKITTQSDHDFKIAPNHLDRQFEVANPATVWVSDITYIKVQQHWLYLTVVIDLADRMVVGWSLARNMDAQNTVIKAFTKACEFRPPIEGFIFHSDRGVQYACKDFKDALKRKKAKQSMSRKGNCWDNAVAESFFKTLKVECIYMNNITSDQLAYSLIFDYIRGWYNTTRIHSALGGISPIKAYMEKTKYLYAA